MSGAGDRATDAEATYARTARWRRMAAVAVLLVTAGAYVGEGAVVLAAVVPLVYAAYPLFVRPPTPALSATRTVSDPAPGHGDRVTVTVTVRNEGRSLLPSVQLVDGVPEHLVVVEGSPRCGTALRAGESTTFRYVVAARRGVHGFGPVEATVRDVAGGSEATLAVETGPDAAAALDCRPSVPGDAVPYRVRRRAGPGDADSTGAGVEFGRIREYRPGDPPGRIDWRRYARDRELATVESPTARSAAVVVCLDARPAAFRARADGEPNAVVYGAAAAESIARAACGRGDRVGLAVLGEAFEYVPPAGGDYERSRVAAALADYRDAEPPDEVPPPGTGVDPEASTRQVDAAAPGEAHVVVVSPLADPAIERVAALLSAGDREVTVVSPDVTAERSRSARIAREERRERIRALRADGVAVVDWDPAAPLAAALARSRAGGGPATDRALADATEGSE